MKKSCYNRKRLVVCVLLFLSTCSFAQNSNSVSVLDPLSYGVVLDNPEMKNVIVKKDITYLEDGKDRLGLDIYSPPRLEATDKRPAIIFLNAIGENAGERKVKSWGIYTSWPKLMAANGYIGITMETDGSRIHESIQGLFNFLDKNGDKYNIDKDRLGVYAASANVSQSVVYLMGEKAYRGIKAAVLYYGRAPAGPFRKDLPVLFVISEGDVRPDSYNNLLGEVLKNNAPWTIKMGTGMPHAFDAYLDNDEARKIIKETISFWKNQLDPVPAPSWPYSKGRDVYASVQMNKPKAISLLKSLTEENPADVNVLAFYADVLRQSEKPAEAELIYQKILTLQPKNVQALIKMAVLYYSKDKTAEAESFVSKAIHSGAMTRNSYAQLGFFLLVANKNRESAMYYEKALAMKPEGFDYYNLACAYAKFNDRDNALKALDNSLKYGYGTRQQFENDSDLDSLKSDSRFKELLSKMK